MHDRIKISIHAPRAGCDSTRRGFPAFAQISIHAPRAGCDPTRVRPPIRWAISIHVPRAGCDRRALTQVETLSISIHVPRAGCDEKHMQSIARCANFNPRTPCGVRLTPQTALAYMLDISIHVPRAGCDLHLDLHGLVFVISIHVPRAGCDRSSVHSSLISGSFQSTYPVRGATRQRYRHDHPAHISIHVPRAGCDRPRSSCPDPARAISIHVPRAGCDRNAGELLLQGGISIHVPRAGCDLIPTAIAFHLITFQSTYPVRGATTVSPGRPSSTANFNPRTPCGVRPLVCLYLMLAIAFQSTYPVRGATANLTILTR